MDDKSVDHHYRTATPVASGSTANISPKKRAKGKPIGIDLFCGVGGMSLGFKDAGFEIAAAIDVDPINVEMHHKNFPKTNAFVADLSIVTGESIRKKANLEGATIDVVFGGPPCQGFSLMGKRDLNDPRSALINHFIRIVAELDANYFVLENVAGLLSGTTKKILDDAIDFAKENGYEVVTPIQILNAADFGVPQNRKRVFVLGYKKNLPAPCYPKKSAVTAPTVWEAIADLTLAKGAKPFDNDTYRGQLGTPSEYAKSLRSKPSDGVYSISGCLRTNHGSKSVKRFKATAQGTQEGISRFFKLSKKGLSNTLRAGTGSSHGSYTAPRPIHPTQPRCITVREAARLHSFPDWFDFHPTRWHGFRQVGNSVPPRLSKTVASCIYDLY